MYQAELMDVSFYADAIWLLERAENARHLEGVVNSSEETRSCRAALLLLAFAFEAFVNEQMRELGIGSEVGKRRDDLKKSKLGFPLGLGSFPKTLTNFTIICEQRTGQWPNFSSPPFFTLLLLFLHRNDLVHHRVEFLPAQKYATGGVSSGWSAFHFLEFAKCCARDWYDAVRTYYSWLGQEESDNGLYAGRITEFQRVYWRLIGRKRQSRRRPPAFVEGIILNADEELFETPGYKQKRAFRYRNRRESFSVLLTAIQCAEHEMSSLRETASWFVVEVHPETMTAPVRAELANIAPVEKADLNAALDEAVRGIRSSYSPPQIHWTDLAVTDLVSIE